MGKFKRGSYYSVNADIRGNSDFDVNLIAEDQKIKFKNISYSTDSDGALSFGVEGNTDEEVSVSVSSDRTSFSINNSGELEGSATMKVGKDTYTVKDKMSLEEVSFKDDYSPEEIAKWLDKFIYRFFTQQFKRSALPDGPKVGSISLSPRGDWRMPSDASFNSFR